MLAEIPPASQALPDSQDPRLQRLAFVLCQHGNLPSEVASCIAALLDRPSIFAISTLSRALHELATIYIYHSILLRIDGPQPADLHYPPLRREHDAWQPCLKMLGTAISDSAVPLLMRTLLSSPCAARSVRRLHLIGLPLRAWRAVNDRFGDNEIRLRQLTPPVIPISLLPWDLQDVARYNKVAPVVLQPDANANFAHFCLTLLRLVVNVESLSIGADYFRFPEFRRGFSSLFEAPQGYQTLQYIELCTDLYQIQRSKSGFVEGHLEAIEGWDQALLTAVSASPASVVVLPLTLASNQATIPLQMTSITRLVLHHWQMAPFAIAPLIAATPHLQYLEYHCFIAYHKISQSSGQGVSHLGIQPLVDALIAHASGIVELWIKRIETAADNPWWADGCHYGSMLQPCIGLAQLRCLQKLAVPYACLLGAIQMEEPVQDWDQVLPPALTHLVWSDHYEDSWTDYHWTETGLLPAAESFLQRRSVLHAPLAKFELHFHHVGYAFNEPARALFTALCEKYGVEGVVRKFRPDRAYPEPQRMLRKGQALPPPP